jgi:hypothetical protein
MIKVSNSSSVDYRINAKSGGTGTNNMTFEWCRHRPGLSWDTVTTSTGKADQTWYHLAMNYNGNNVYCYLNGSIVGAASKSGTGNQSYDSQFSVCGEHRGSYRANGIVDDVAFWDVSVTGGAWAAIYNSGTPIDLTSNSGNYTFADDLKGYWRFNEATGTQIADSSGSGYHLTKAGGTWSGETPS